LVTIVATDLSVSQLERKQHKDLARVAPYLTRTPLCSPPAPEPFPAAGKSRLRSSTSPEIFPDGEDGGVERH